MPSNFNVRLLMVLFFLIYLHVAGVCVCTSVMYSVFCLYLNIQNHMSNESSSFWLNRSLAFQFVLSVSNSVW